MKKLFTLTVMIISVMTLSACASHVSHKHDSHANAQQQHANVIEVATFKLADGMSYDDFSVLDSAVEAQHVSKQPGFISRHSARGENGEWLVVVYWENHESAQASMNSFMNAPAAAQFMKGLDASTMKMMRYTQNKPMHQK